MTAANIGIQILYFGGLAYFIFKLVRMYSPGWEDAYIPARKELTTFAVLTIIAILMTIINSCMCAANYNKGLKPYVVRRKIESEEEKLATTGSSYAPYAMGDMSQNSNYMKPPVRPERMEID